MSVKNITYKSHKKYFLILILVSFIISFSYNYLQYGVDGGLVLAKKIIFPDNESPVKYYLLNSWTAIHQISFILIKFGFSVEIISKIIMLFSTLFFAFGVFFFSNSIANNINFAFVISLLTIFLGKNFGDTDYPSLIYSEHTYGMISLSLATLVFGLIANKNLLLASMTSVVLITIHPIVGLWIITIGSISIFFTKLDKFEKKRIIIGFLIGFFFLLISFTFFYLNAIDKIPYQHSNLATYLEYWDGHRSISREIHFEYLIKTFILFLSIYFFSKYYYKSESDCYNLHFIVIFFTVIISSIIYLIYKIFPNIFPQIFILSIPSRFIILHSIVGWPIIVSVIFYFFQMRFNSQKISLIFYIFFGLLFIQNLDKIFDISKNFYNFKTVYNSKVINLVNKEKADGYVITTSSLNNTVFKKTKKPILLQTESMDFVPYHPYLVDKFFSILKDIYDIEKNKPPQKNNPSISDKYIKNLFEKKTIDNWIYLKKKYKIIYVIVPNEWNLNLNLVEKDQFLKLYKIL